VLLDTAQRRLTLKLALKTRLNAVGMLPRFAIE